jgi:tetratricopeptide (TPR) repeat protein
MNQTLRKPSKKVPPEIVLLQGGHPEMAISQLDAKLAADPQNWEYHTNIGIGYRMTNQFQLALLHHTLATQIMPAAAVVWHNLGVTKTELGDFEGAFLAHQKAYNCEPDNQQVCLGYAYCLLRYGKFEEAWPLWEQARYHTSFWEMPGLALWTGEEPLEGKKILIFMEGGYGDSIMFLRWMAELKDRGAITFLSAFEKQARLFVGHPWVDHVLTDKDYLDPEKFDYSASIMSLPALLRCKADAIPAATRYIMAHPDEVLRYRGKIHRGKKPIVGICWGAEEGVVPKKSRTISDAEIEPLKGADVDWVSLWPGHRLPWMSEYPVSDWSDTAALITQLDCVVSVDTAVAHLSAAMGKSTKIIVPLGSDWKWFRNITTSPWYPSVELIRNDDPVKWTGAIQKVLDGVHGLLRLPSGLRPEHGDSPSAAVGQ